MKKNKQEKKIKKIKKTPAIEKKKFSKDDIEMVLNVGKVYERVKFKKTGLARILIGRKNPEKSVNFEQLLKFCKLAKSHDIIPNFYFHSMYGDNGKIIPTKPECAYLNKKTNLHFYGEYIKNIRCDEPDKEIIVSNLEATRKNISDFMDTHQDLEKKFFEINILNKEYPDWIVMLKLGIISPYLLFLNDETLKFVKFLKFKTENNSPDIYIKHYNELNKKGKLKELLIKTFGDLI